MVELGHSYVAYGLGIRSDLPLPELLAAESGADVEVRSGAVGAPPATATVSGRSFRVTGDGVYLFWDDVGTFRVHGGREITVDPAPRAEEPVLRLFVLGPALAVLLDQRGRHVLHASAVAIDGRVVAFLAPSGSGKSTLAAALHARGHALVADDLVPLELGSRGASTAPGFPHLKLFPDVATQLGDGKLVRVSRAADKGLRRADALFAAAPLPLERIYVLGSGEREAIHRVGPHEAAIELVRHSWCARLRDAASAASELEECARLAENVSVRRLRYPRSLERLSALARLVEDDLER